MFKFVHHVHYVVADVDAVVRYMEESFGMKPDHQEDVEDDGYKEALYSAGQTLIEFTSPRKKAQVYPTSWRGTARACTTWHGVWMAWRRGLGSWRPGGVSCGEREASPRAPGDTEPSTSSTRILRGSGSSWRRGRQQFSVPRYDSGQRWPREGHARGKVGMIFPY